MMLKELLSVIQIGTNTKLELLNGNNIKSVTFNECIDDITNHYSDFLDMSVLTATVKNNVFIITLCPLDD
jgi:hypothetical protein